MTRAIVELASLAMDLWAYRHSAKIDFSRLGKPTDNAFVESFNGTFRAECLDTHWFMVSVRRNHIDSYRLLAAQAVGVSSGSLWMDELASPGRTAAR